MTPDELFDQIEGLVQQVVNQTVDQHIYVEREMRGTYPSMVVRLFSSARAQKKVKDGAKIISSVKALPQGEAPSEPVSDGSQNDSKPENPPKQPQTQVEAETSAQ